MRSHTAQITGAVAKKSIAIVMAALLCMPMTGFEYIAYANEATSEQVSKRENEAPLQNGEPSDAIGGGLLPLILRTNSETKPRQTMVP